MQRRQLLQGLTAASVLSPATRLFAATDAGPEKPRFLLVFLRGGYDASHLLVPIGSSFYYEQRPAPVSKPPCPSTPTGACIRPCANRSTRCCSRARPCSFPLPVPTI